MPISGRNGQSGDIRDIGLADEGKLRIDWADAAMPVLRQIRERFEREKPLDGMRIGACLHVTTETANLIRTLQAGGAEVLLCASNPLSTQDDAAASLTKHFGAAVFAVNGEDSGTYYAHIRAVLDAEPQMTIDDGADLVAALHSERPEQLKSVKGGMEETTTGVIRLRSLAAEGKLGYPIFAVNDALTKHMFDNRYGSGQSTMDGVLRATNRLIAGKTVVVCGYGWCGRGVAERARGLGGHVIVTEVDPLRALEAALDGYRVMPMDDAAAEGDLFVTVTGGKHALTTRHFEKMKDGAMVANSGHFDIEIDIPGLEALSRSSRLARPHVQEYSMADGRRICLLGEGRLINLVAAEGHSASVMDMSFANQALAAEHLAKSEPLEPAVYPVPPEIDARIAELKLSALGIEIDTLSGEQAEYLASWTIGT